MEAEINPGNLNKGYVRVCGKEHINEQVSQGRKAYLLEIPNDQGETTSAWVPKSLVMIDPAFGSEPYPAGVVKIKKWFVVKNNIPIAPGLIHG